MKLRPYQLEVMRAVAESIMGRRGLTITVEIARQGGKNELSAHLEVLMLTAHMVRGGSAVKCSPTFKPQTVVSISRLKQRLDDFGFAGIWQPEQGYIIRLGNARQVFLSAEESASVVGHTADIMLEVDEAQDVSRDKYTRDFRPMASASNATTVMYGTTWDDRTLLEETKQLNLELEKKDGVRRHFGYDWQEVAKYNPAYGAFVESERQRLGGTHPLFLTQYALKPIRGGGGFLSRSQLAAVGGEHPRQRAPVAGELYVAGIDIAGEAEASALCPGRDSTVITIARVKLAQGGPCIEVIEHYAWTGVKHPELYAQMVDILRCWNCKQVVVDATGIGEPVASFLKKALGPRIEPFVFTQQSKSELGFDLLAAVNSGRLKIYRSDGSKDYQELMYELERARSVFRPNQTLNFYVEPSDGHDDYLMSLALTVRAGELYRPRRATGDGS
ncbi:MAG: hypothetical protein N3E40_02425 [Dehalococcoidia bacterium]|nr:hypothetical protein [Dehalococcoidia bacterium]